MTANATDYLFLNREGRWNGFHWHGLDLDEDGRLALMRLPRLASPGDDRATLPRPARIAGVAADRDGTVYYAVPSEHGIFRVGGCAPGPERLPCTSATSGALTSIASPRGLWLGTRRHALYIADADSDRIQIVDLDSFTIADSWGGFASPTSVIGDRDNTLFIVDASRRTIVKINMRGEVDRAFAANLQHAGVEDPADLALDTGAARLFVIDRAHNDVAVLSPDGQPIRGDRGRRVRFGAGDLQAPLGMAAADGRVYVGDNSQRRIVVFALQNDRYARIGAAVDYRAPVAGLTIAGSNLIAHAGGIEPPYALALSTGYVSSGFLWSGPIEPRTEAVAWHRLRAELRSAPGAHSRFLFATSEPTMGPPLSTTGDIGHDPFTAPEWQPAPIDVSDFFLGDRRAVRIWLAAHFVGDGRSTPSLAQLRIEYDHRSYAANLPAVYRRPGPGADMLTRLLSLFESFFNEPEWALERLPGFFDPAAAPEQVLSWLAGWLDLRLDQRLTVEQKRRAIERAFASYAWRGTPRALRDGVHDRLGMDVVISEPAQGAPCWALPSTAPSCADDASPGNEPAWESTRLSVLGATTVLAASSPQGAVVGTTAVLDRSPLIDGDKFGEPLFTDRAFEFAVLVRRGQLRGPEAMAQLHAAIDEDKPAHTNYHVCVIEPRMRVGFQARIGVDTVVGGGSRTIRTDGESRLDGRATLGGQSAARLGQGSQIGITTRLG